ncbi:amidohydrolase [bacterium]|nr:amidohydrolase [bacterium]
MKNKIFSWWGCFLILLWFIPFLHSAESSDVLVVRGGKILTISHGTIENAEILIEDGKIKKVGPRIQIPENSELIQAPKGWILPGLVVPHTILGTGNRYGSSDANETSNPNTAQLQIIDAVNPFDKDIHHVLTGGVTTAMVTPGRKNVIGGQSAVLKLKGSTVDQMCLRCPGGVKFSLGKGPKSTYGKKGRLPSTRMGSAYVIRKAFHEAEAYLKKIQKKSKGQLSPPRNLKLETLAKVRNKELTAFIECYRVDDIMTALRIIDEFDLKAVLVGCTEGYKVVHEIAERKVPVIVGPLGVGPRRMETRNVRVNNAAALAGAGVKIAIKPDESLGVGRIRELPLIASFLVKGGLDRSQAFRAITLSAAEIMSVDDRVGSIEPGKDADLVIFDGDPLYYKSHVQRVMINGETVYLKNEQ